MRVVLDTNVLVSAALIAGGREARILRAWRAGTFDLVVSPAILEEKKKGDTLVRAKPGEAGGILLGVARSADRVLKGEDILVRNFEPRKDPTNDSHITHRNATILASQALHLGDWFFRAPALGVQPELGR